MSVLCFVERAIVTLPVRSSVCCCVVSARGMSDRANPGLSVRDFLSRTSYFNNSSECVLVDANFAGDAFAAELETMDAMNLQNSSLGSV